MATANDQLAAAIKAAAEATAKVEELKNNHETQTWRP